MRFLPCFLVLPLFAALLAPARSAAEAPPRLDRMHGGVRLVAIAPDKDTRFDVSLPSPEAVLERMADALDLIRRKSPESFAAIERLKAAGRVTVIYFPNNFRDRNRPNSQAVALFLPAFLRSRGLAAGGADFAVVVNQFGAKWPAEELAPILVHELAGHGIQHLRGHTASERTLDLECEASLYQERAYQDLGTAKKSRTVVLFRRQMEYRYCADFRAYLQARAPAALALWDRRDPDVAVLLDHFGEYRRVQAAAAALSSRSR
jgi:hypothetical protein